MFVEGILEHGYQTLACAPNLADSGTLFGREQLQIHFESCSTSILQHIYTHFFVYILFILMTF